VPGLETDAIAKIKLSTSPSGRVKKKTEEIYTDKEGVLSLELMSIESMAAKYTLSAPIYVQVNKVGKGYLIENEQFDIYATGRSEQEAKIDLYEQFDMTYKRLIELPMDQLSHRLQNVKRAYELIVKETTPYDNGLLKR
jgi:hypothetical protein